MLGKTVITTVSSWEDEKINYWHKYHKQKCPNIRILQNIPYPSKSIGIKDPDISFCYFPIQVPYTMFFSMAARVENESKFDYFVLMEHDAFIVGDWLNEELHRMRDNNINCLTPPVQYKHEHRKDFEYCFVAGRRGLKLEDFKWTLSNCFIMDRVALRMVNETYLGFTGYEVGVINTLEGRCNIDQNKYINIEHNRAGALRREEVDMFSKQKVKNGVLHAVKDFSVIRQVTGFRV